MPSSVPYHISQQYAYSLLGPVCQALSELEERAEGYLAHLDLSPEDRAAIQSAHDTLTAACQQVTALRRATSRTSS